MTSQLRRTLTVAFVILVLGGGAYYVGKTVPPTVQVPELVSDLSTLTGGTLPTIGTLPPIRGVDGWINTPALSNADLKGKAVLVDFWTYSCINCLRTIPNIEQLWNAYKGDGLVVIGMHTPEFAFEKDAANIQAAVTRLGITYPVAIDSEYAMWGAINTCQCWPAQYLYDGDGNLRYQHAGEGGEEALEAAIRQLTGAQTTATALVEPDLSAIRSPETYFGYARAERYAGQTAIVADTPTAYVAGSVPGLNGWDLGGSWNVGKEYAGSTGMDGHLRFTFSAPIANFVLSSANGAPVTVHVRIDGKEIDASERGDDLVGSDLTVSVPRLYQVLKNLTGTHTVELIPSGPGLQAFTITFG